MLLCKHCCRHQNGDLFAAHYSLECCPQGYLSLAISDITTYQPIHGTLTLHVLLDLTQRIDLITGLPVRKRCFQFLLPDSVHFKGMPSNRLTGGIQV